MKIGKYCWMETYTNTFPISLYCKAECKATGEKYYHYGVGVGVSVGVSVAVAVGVAVNVDVGVAVTVGERVGLGITVAGCELWRVMCGATQSP